MSLWVVRAGRHGEQQETAINACVVCHGWNELPDYSAIRTRDDLRTLYKQTYPTESDRRAIAGMGQIWRFANEIQNGDLVALPLRTESAFMFGYVTGEYQYKKLASNVFHTRSVKWHKKLQRSTLPEDILLVMSLPPTVIKVSRNDAENRVRRLLESPESLSVARSDSADDNEGIVDEWPNIGEVARDEILKYIQAKFKEHDLARLVDAVLRAQGYKTQVSPPGPDGGVDILAVAT